MIITVQGTIQEIISFAKTLEAGITAEHRDGAG